MSLITKPRQPHKATKAEAGRLGGLIGGALGGAARSAKKARSSRANGKLGGRPRKNSRTVRS